MREGRKEGKNRADISDFIDIDLSIFVLCYVAETFHFFNFYRKIQSLSGIQTLDLQNSTVSAILIQLAVQI